MKQDETETDQFAEMMEILKVTPGSTSHYSVPPPTTVPTHEFVTPEIAREWLKEFNTENRNIQKAALNKYIRDIENGSWEDIGDPVRFDTNGLMIDGQHRLLAIIHTGVAMWLLVVRGIKPSARAVIDSGARRSSANALQIEGFKNSSATSAATSALSAFEKGMFKHAGSRPDYSPSHAEVVELATHYHSMGFEDDVTQATSDYRHIKITATVLAVSRYLQRQIASEEEVDEFWYGACFTAGPGDARWTLRNWAARRADDNKSRKYTSMGLYAVAVCWNAWREGRNTKIAPVSEKEIVSDSGHVLQPAVYRPIPKMK